LEFRRVLFRAPRARATPPRPPSSPTVPSRSPRSPCSGRASRGRGSGVDAVVAEDVVEGRLVVPLALLQTLEDQHGREPERPALELLGAGAADGDAPVGDAASADLLAGLDVDDGHG